MYGAKPQELGPQSRTRVPDWVRIFQRSRVIEMACAFNILCGVTGCTPSLRQAYSLNSNPCPLASRSANSTKRIHGGGSVPPSPMPDTTQRHSTHMAGSNWKPHPALGTPCPFTCAFREFDRLLTFKIENLLLRDEGCTKDLYSTGMQMAVRRPH